MDAFALTPAERKLFAALRARDVKFLIIGLGAAVLEGALVATQDIDVWFEPALEATLRAREKRE